MLKMIKGPGGGIHQDLKIDFQSKICGDATSIYRIFDVSM